MHGWWICASRRGGGCALRRSAAVQGAAVLTAAALAAALSPGGLASGAPPAVPAALPAAALPPLEVGDVVLREGVGADSRLIAQVAGGPYTHVGIVVSTAPVLILHAAPDDDPQHLQQVILSTPAAFRARARRLAVKRYPLSPAQRAQLQEQARDYVGRPFSLSAETDALYCSTLVSRLLGAQVRLQLREVEVRLPLLGGRFLSPQGFFEDEGSVLLYAD